MTTGPVDQLRTYYLGEACLLVSQCLGEAIRAERKRQALSITQLAKLLHVGTSTVGAWERGERWPEREALAAIGHWLKDSALDPWGIQPLALLTSILGTGGPGCHLVATDPVGGTPGHSPDPSHNGKETQPEQA